VVAITAIALGVLLMSPLWVAAQGTDPESVIRALMDALNAQDMDAGMALIADDTVITLLPPPAKVFSGKEQIRAYWEAWLSMNGYVEVSNFQVNGDRATWSADVWTEKYRDLNIAPMVADGEGIVQDGVLKSWTFTKTDESGIRCQGAGGDGCQSRRSSSAGDRCATCVDRSIYPVCPGGRAGGSCRTG
jgi:hypothetical protein